MEYRQLGRSGLRVSPICLGTMMFGGATDEVASRAIVDHARDAGVNFIDTADAYTEGRSEEITGRAIAAHRHDWVLATKVANAIGEGPNRAGLSRKWVLQACDDSLRRLGTEFIDIYYLHKEDLTTPLAETVRAIGDLVRQGKIRHFGVSNYRSWRVAEICRLCDELGIDRPVVSQPYYNAMNRMPEVEHLPACGYYGLGVASYSPLARGVLTGKYEPGETPQQGTRAARGDKRILQTEWRPDDQAACRRARHDADPVRRRLGAQQPPPDGGHRRPAHAGAVAGLSGRARRHLHVRGRGADRRSGADRASLDAGLQRPRLSDRGAAGAHGCVSGRRGICLVAAAHLTERGCAMRTASFWEGG